MAVSLIKNSQLALSGAFPLTYSFSTAVPGTGVTLPTTSDTNLLLSNTNASAAYSSISLQARTTSPGKGLIALEYVSANVGKLTIRLSTGAATNTLALTLLSTGDVTFAGGVTCTTATLSGALTGTTCRFTGEIRMDTMIVTNGTGAGFRFLHFGSAYTNQSTYLGTSSGDAASSAINNTAIGSGSMNGLSGGTFNTSLGAFSLAGTLSGTQNVGCGYQAGALISSGNGNTTVGYRAGYRDAGANVITTGSNNTHIGYNTGFTNSTQRDNTTALGNGAIVTASNQMVFGNSSITANVFQGSIYFSTTLLIHFGTSLSNASFYFGGSSGSLTSSAVNNTGLGQSSLGSVTTGDFNTALGESAAASVTTGAQNTSVGSKSMIVGNGSSNTAVGYSTLRAAGTAGKNCAIGANSLNHTTADNNSALGYNSMVTNTSGTNNVSIGYNSLDTQTTGSSNVAVGYQAGKTATGANANVTGSNNTWVGFNAGPGSATQFDNSTALGNGALNTASNQMVFGNSSITSNVFTGNVVAPTLNSLTVTTSTGTLTITNAKTLSVSNTLTFAGTDGSSVAFGTGGTVAYVANTLAVFASTTSAQLASVISDETGTGALVFASGPTLAGNVGFNGSSFGGGTNVLFIGDASVVPTTNPTGGGILYSESGVLKFRQSSGTITTMSSASATWVRGEPTGSINSSNVTFTLPSTPDSNSLILVLDGNTLEPGGNDYSLSGVTITFTTAPSTGSKIIYFYTLTAPIAGDRYKLAYSEVTGTSQSMAVDTIYTMNNASLVTGTLPVTANVGDEIEVVGKGAGGWKIAQNSGQTTYFGDQTTTAGTGGYLASTHRRDVVKLICITQDTEWQARSSQGSITIN